MPLRDDPASFGDLHVKVPKGCQNRAKQSHCHCQRCVFSVFIPHSFLTSQGCPFGTVSICILWLLVQLLFDLLPIQTLTHLSPVHVRVLLLEVSVEFPKTLTAAQKDT